MSWSDLSNRALPAEDSLLVIVKVFVLPTMGIS
jgi:hypothetical protein